MSIDPEVRVRYQEVQYYRQRWILLLLLAVSGLSWYSFLLQIILGTPTSTTPLPNWLVFTLFILLGIGVPLLIFFTKLVTEVTDESLNIKFKPFANQTFPIKNIAAVESVEDGPFKDIGFWEISWGAGNPRIYNICGYKGIEISLRSGENILIGTQNPDQLARVINNLIPRMK
jgi:hypothetical protein